MKTEVEYRGYIRRVGSEEWILTWTKPTQPEIFHKFNAWKDKENYDMKVEKRITVVEVMYENKVRCCGQKR